MKASELLDLDLQKKINEQFKIEKESDSSTTKVKDRSSVSSAVLGYNNNWDGREDDDHSLILAN
jgi:hypothetical protein